MVARGGDTALGFACSLELGIWVSRISFVHQVQLQVASLGCHCRCGVVLVAGAGIAKLLAGSGISVTQFDECCTLPDLGYAIKATHSIESAGFRLKTMVLNGVG